MWNQLPIWARFVVLPVGLLLALTVQVGYAILWNKEQRLAYNAIDIAGRQRMLNERIRRLAQRGNTIEVNQAILLFQNRYDSLLEGRPLLIGIDRIALAPAPASVAAEIRRAKTLMHAVENRLQKRAGVEMSALNEQLATLTNGIVNRYSSHFVQATDHFNTVEMFATAFVAFVALIVSAFMYLALVRPLNQKTKDLEDARGAVQGIINTAVDGIITISQDGLITSFNPAAERLFGYSSIRVIGNNIKMLMPDYYANEHDGYLQNYLATGEEKIIGIGREVTGLRADGTTFPMYLSVGAMKSPQNISFTGIVRDITAQKENEAGLLEARRQAEAASVAKSQFLANMSHELRTPLNAIIGYSDLTLEEMGINHEERYFNDVRKIKSAGRHLLDLINNILDLSKVEAGRMDLLLSSFGLCELVDETVETVKPYLEKKPAIKLQLAVDDKPIRSDRLKLKQCLLNVLSNAVKFTDEGSISVTASTTISSKGRDMVRFEVTDTGIGVKKEYLERLFEPFSQADEGTTRQHGGTGLGLSLTRELCQILGGDIRAISEHGEGTTIIMQIPAMADSNARNALHAENLASAAYREKPLVFIVDDDPAVRETFGRHLQNAGYEVATTTNGSDALDKIAEVRPDVVVLDVMMPGKNGWQLLSEIKTDAALRHIPIIMATIVDEPNRGYALGASDYLVKPVERTQLLDAVAGLCKEENSSVLIVEDDEMSRLLFAGHLNNAGYRTIEAVNGRDGLEKLEKSEPSLIILDLMMPEIDGFEFLEYLKKSKRWASTPVIIITAKDLTPKDVQRLNGHLENVLQKSEGIVERLITDIGKKLSKGGDLNAS